MKSPYLKLQESKWSVMTEEEKQVVAQTIQEKPEEITNSVLKLCNIVRQPLNVHGNNDFIKKRSGLSNGRHLLRPDLRIRFGTFGFRKNQPSRDIGSNMDLGNESRTTKANTIRKDAESINNNTEMRT